VPDKTPVWLLTRYEDISALLRDERFVKDKTTMGLVLPSTATDARRHFKKLSVFEYLERDEAEFLRKTTATLQQLPQARFFCFVLSL
jgi:hypothetical protein